MKKCIGRNMDMKKCCGVLRIASGIMILALLLAGSANASNLTVCPSGCEYSSIQKAIKASSNGDTILVYSGIYYENVNITKQLTLRGVGNPVVDAAGIGSAITLSANGITLEGFAATGSGNDQEAGIKVTSNKNTISGNDASNNKGVGISLEYDSNNNTLIGNNASNNDNGISLGYSSNVLIENNASNNSHRGISLGYSSNNNTLIGNNASNNEEGISLGGSNHTLTGNMMTENTYNFNIDDTDFNNHIDTTNLVDGKSIYYIIGAANTIYDSSRNAGTFYCINCVNVSLKDLNLSNNGYGVFFWNTTLSKIQNVKASNDGNYNYGSGGISLSHSSNNTLIGNNASNNRYGIHLSFSNNNTLSSNIASNNSYDGIHQEDSNNNKLRNNNACNNTDVGISLEYASNNILTGNNASNNRYGIQISTDSEGEDGDFEYYCTNNKLKNNIMTGNVYNFELDVHKDSDFQNQIDKSNLVDGKPIYYINGAKNTIYDSSTNARTFYCINCVNVTIKDLNLTDNGYGVFFQNTTMSKIQNVKVYNNSDYGIILRYSSYNMLTGNNASNNGINSGGGISLYISSDNRLIANNALNNGNEYGYYSAGISLYISSNNKLIGNNASSNKGYGIDLQYSNNNRVSGNNASNNNIGISLTSSRKNKINNNIFNNTNNFDLYNNKINTWNTKKQSGTNIIGGPILGGNFWGYPNGTGFSQICKDVNNNGICEKRYILDENNIDHLPLSLNFTKDISPPKSVSNLKNVTYAKNFINWTWTDPKNIDFKKVMVFIDNTFKRNVSKGKMYYNATNFTPNTKHTISTWTVDMNGNINKTWKNSSAWTAN